MLIGIDNRWKHFEKKLESGAVINGQIATFDFDVNDYPSGTEFLVSEVTEGSNGIRAFRITPIEKNACS